MIYDDLEYEGEADIFANQQKYVKKLHPIEIFNANIEAGNEKQMLIKTLLESYSLTVSAAKRAGAVGAIGALELIYDEAGFVGLDKVLQLIMATWEGEEYSFSANMLNGVYKLQTIYGDKLKEQAFIERCGKHSVKEIMRTARERKGGSFAIAETLLLIYNKKAKHTLSYELLYKSKSKNRYTAATKVEDEEVDKIAENQNESAEEEKQVLLAVWEKQGFYPCFKNVPYKYGVL